FVVAILVFVLLASFILPHTGNVRGWDVLFSSHGAGSAGVALPSRVFTWLALVFGVGFSMLALTTRRWALAWIALAGSAIAGGGGVSPLPPLLGIGLRLLRILGTARRRRLLGLLLVLLGADAELLGAGLRLRIRPTGVAGVPDLLLDGPQPPLEVGGSLPRYFADRVPFVRDRPQRRAGGLVVAGVQLLCLRQQRLLGGGVGVQLGVLLRGRRVAGAEERVL